MADVVARFVQKVLELHGFAAGGEAAAAAAAEEEGANGADGVGADGTDGADGTVDPGRPAALSLDSMLDPGGGAAEASEALLEEVAKDTKAQVLHLMDELKRIFLDGFDTRSVSSARIDAYRRCIDQWDELQHLVQASPPSSSLRPPLSTLPPRPPSPLRPSHSLAPVSLSL